MNLVPCDTELLGLGQNAKLEKLRESKRDIPSKEFTKWPPLPHHGPRITAPAPY